jgi:hypothetical protein
MCKPMAEPEKSTPAEVYRVPTVAEIGSAIGPSFP